MICLSLLWHHVAGNDQPQNDFLCVRWDVKPDPLTYLAITKSYYSKKKQKWATIDKAEETTTSVSITEIEMTGIIVANTLSQITVKNI